MIQCSIDVIDMPTNAEDFIRELRKAPRIADSVAIKVRRETAAVAYLAMTKHMPVDTGLMRGNTQITVNGPAKRVLQRFATGSAGVSSETDAQFLEEELLKFKNGLDPYATVHVGSSVEYAPHVNDGTDRFAGYHFVEIAQAIVAKLQLTELDLGYDSRRDIASQETELP